jgi:hypothetical protein
MLEDGQMIPGWMLSRIADARNRAREASENEERITPRKVPLKSRVGKEPEVSELEPSMLFSEELKRGQEKLLKEIKAINDANHKISFEKRIREITKLSELETCWWELISYLADEPVIMARTKATAGGTAPRMQLLVSEKVSTGISYNFPCREDS